MPESDWMPASADGDARDESGAVMDRLTNALKDLADIVVHQSTSSPRQQNTDAFRGRDWHHHMLELENSISRVRGAVTECNSHPARDPYTSPVIPLVSERPGRPRTPHRSHEASSPRHRSPATPRRTMTPSRQRSTSQLVPDVTINPYVAPSPPSEARPRSAAPRRPQSAQLSSTAPGRMRGRTPSEVGDARGDTIEFARPQDSSYKSPSSICSDVDVRSRSQQRPASASMSQCPSNGTLRRNGVLSEAEKKELAQVAKLIGEKAAQKFKTIWQCFRFADEDHDGRLSRAEVLRLCCEFNVGESVSERFFNLLDTDGDGIVEFEELREYLGPHIQPGYQARSRSASRSKSRPRQCPSAANFTFKESSEDPQAELERLSWLIGSKAALKFTSVNKCFRFVDTNHDGLLSREEVKHFFRSFNIDDSLSERFFDLLDVDGSGEIDYNELRAKLGPYIVPGYNPPTSSSRQPSRSPARRVSKAELEAKETQKELQNMLGTIGDKIFAKYKHARDAFRFVDEDKDGHLTRVEIRRFIENFGLPRRIADKCYDYLDQDKNGSVSYAEFMSFFGTIVQPGHQHYRVTAEPKSEGILKRPSSASRRRCEVSSALSTGSKASTASGSTASKSSSSKSSKSSSSSELPLVPSQFRHRLEHTNNLRGNCNFFPTDFEHAPKGTCQPHSASVAPYAQNLPVEAERQIRSSRTFDSRSMSERLGSRSPVRPQSSIYESHEPELRQVKRSGGQMRSVCRDAQGRVILNPGTRGHVIAHMRTDMPGSSERKHSARRGRDCDVDALLRSWEAPGGGWAAVQESPKDRAPSCAKGQPAKDHTGQCVFDAGHGAPLTGTAEALGSPRRQASEPPVSDDEYEGSSQRLTSRPPHSGTLRGDTPRGRGSRSPARHAQNHRGESVFDLSGKPFTTVAQALGQSY